MSRRALRVLVLAQSLTGGAACTTVKLAYTPGELRAEVARRAPAIPAAEVVAPFEIDEAHAARAREIVARARTDLGKTRALVAALFDPQVFHLRYSSAVTTDAEETLRSGRGNCLALASAFVGLARAAGLQAFYIDASTRVHETRYQGDITVNSGHVTAMVRAEGEQIGLDFGQMGPFRWYRVLDDLEALANYYNNRGFEILESAEGGPGRADWSRASHEFWLSVQVMPRFARAWNNLGIAAVHLGRAEEAIENYRTAIAADPTLAAARNNLGSLFLEEGRLAEAIASLEAAARLDPDGPHIQYNLALARVRSGDRDGAARALQRALQLRSEYPEAQAMLDRLALSPRQAF
jgi:tetratricopeptide (TPR) repeat protein